MNQLSITCDISRNLLSDLHADRLDVVVALIDEANSQYLVRAWEEQPVWAAAENARVHKMSPLPLVTHPEGCAYRNRIVEALNRAGRDWRVAYCSPGITGLQDAVAAGLGVSALTRKTLRQGIRTLSSRDGFPMLEKIQIGLFYKHLRQSRAGMALIEQLIAGLDDAADADFKPAPHPSGTALMGL